MTFAKHASPVEAETDGFRVRLAGGSLVVEMLAHHATEESARAAVEPYLKAWEIGHALNVGGEPEFRFEFVRVEIIDRDPPPPGTPQTIEASALIHTRAILSATASVERGSLPGAPTRFVLDADLETLWTAGVRIGKGESLSREWRISSSPSSKCMMVGAQPELTSALIRQFSRPLAAWRLRRET